MKKPSIAAQTVAAAGYRPRATRYAVRNVGTGATASTHTSAWASRSADRPVNIEKTSKAKPETDNNARWLSGTVT
jgi:hypothetical protein